MTNTNTKKNATNETATNIGWKNIDGAKRKALAVGGRVIQLMGGRYMAQGQPLIGRDGKLSCVYYGPRGATYICPIRLNHTV